MGQNKCKGLVIQNNPFSYNTGNGKTVASMLSQWDNDRLAQIYVSDFPPDFSICKQYFKMADKAALKSFLKHQAFGTEITEGAIADKNASNVQVGGEENALLKKVKGWMRESSFVAVIRDFVWCKSKWKNEELCRWLDQVNPDFVYFIAGNMAVFYDMAFFICERYDIPLYVHIGDDYFIYRKGINIWKNLHRRKMSKKVEQAINKSEYVFAICDKLARIFKERYGGRYYVCMNCVDLEEGCIPEVKKHNSNLKLVYAGNLGINRWKVLNLIGQALEELRQEKIYAELDVYSSFTPEKRILKKLTIPPVLKFCGSVFGEELKQVKGNADILVHVEAFEMRYRQLTYTAMSTKISEYLSAGQTILAVGPEEAASIEFLKENNVAMVVTERSKEAIKEQIRRFIGEAEEFADMNRRAVQIARERFSRTENAGRIYKIISEECDKCTS